MELQMSGQALRSNPKGLGLTAHLQRHTLFCPAGKMGRGGWVSLVTLYVMQACYAGRLVPSDIALLNNWSSSLIARALTSNLDLGDGMVSVAIVAVTMRSMPSKSVCI